MDAEQKRLFLFGGDSSWKANDWTASDDRVRGGKSQSYLSPSSDSKIASFNGTLDIKTLGGAGFASQRTTAENKTWDLSRYDGIQLLAEKADGMLSFAFLTDLSIKTYECKRYTLILKDALLPKDPSNGRDQATISYEYDFETTSTNSSTTQKWFIPWSSFKPTYRGKEKPDAKALDSANVRRISIMMRSFFGGQEGTFSLDIRSIAAVHSSRSSTQGSSVLPVVSMSGKGDVEKGEAGSPDPAGRNSFISSPWFPVFITFAILTAGWWLYL